MAAAKKPKAKKTTRKPAAKKPDGRAARGKYAQWVEGEGLEQIKAWSRNGLTQADIAHNVGCSLSTFKEWLKKYPDLSAAIKHTREVADIRVENALYKRATGYDYEEVVREEGPKGVTVRVTKKHVPPSEVAALFWLKNRKPDVWRDKPAEKDDDGHVVWEVRFAEDEEDEEDGGTTADPASAE